MRNIIPLLLFIFTSQLHAVIYNNTNVINQNIHDTLVEAENVYMEGCQILANNVTINEYSVAATTMTAQLFSFNNLDFEDSTLILTQGNMDVISMNGGDLVVTQIYINNSNFTGVDINITTVYAENSSFINSNLSFNEGNLTNCQVNGKGNYIYMNNGWINGIEYVDGVAVNGAFFKVVSCAYLVILLLFIA